MANVYNGVIIFAAEPIHVYGEAFMKSIKTFVVLTWVLSSLLLFSSSEAATPGIARWAKSVVAGTNSSAFSSVTRDSAGNIYAVGTIAGTESYDFGNGVTVAGTASGSNVSNVVLVKYNSSGTAQWAKSVVAGADGSRFTSVILDSAGNIYTVGYIEGSGSYDFGNGATVAGRAPGLVLVKYNSSGAAQWAKSVVAGTNNSSFYSVTLDSAGNIYAAGEIDGAGSYDFGNGVTVAGTCTGGSGGFGNVVLVKYNSSGNAQWAKSVVAGTGRSGFFSVTLDSSGNIYAIGVACRNNTKVTRRAARPFQISD